MYRQRNTYGNGGKRRLFKTELVKGYIDEEQQIGYRKIGDLWKATDLLTGRGVGLLHKTLKECATAIETSKDYEIMVRLRSGESKVANYEEMKSVFQFLKEYRKPATEQFIRKKCDFYNDKT